MGDGPSVLAEIRRAAAEKTHDAAMNRQRSNERTEVQRFMADRGSFYCQALASRSMTLPDSTHSTPVIPAALVAT